MTPGPGAKRHNVGVAPESQGAEVATLQSAQRKQR